MKKLLALCALLCLLGSAALAEAPLASVAETACSLVRSEDYYLVYCYARVHNDSSGIICLDEGEFTLLDGDQALAIERVTRLWPYFVNPGEDGYLFDVVAFEPNEDGVVMPSVTGIEYNLKCMPVSVEYSSYELSGEPVIEMSQDGSLSVVCELINNTPVTAWEPTVAVSLLAKNGRMLYADGRTLEDVGIPPEGRVSVRFAVKDEFVEQWTDYGMPPETARMNASFRSDDD